MQSTNQPFPYTDVIQSIGIVVTLLIAVWQMRTTVRHARATTELTLMLKLEDINKVLLEHPGLWSKLDAAYEANAATEELERAEYVAYMIFNTLELAFRHHNSYNLMEEEDWAEWNASLSRYLGKQYILGWWHVNREEYGARFRKHVDAQASKVLAAQGAT